MNINEEMISKECVITIYYSLNSEKKFYVVRKFGFFKTRCIFHTIGFTHDWNLCSYKIVIQTVEILIFVPCYPIYPKNLFDR